MAVPTAFCVAGGGFTSLSTAMGFANAFHEIGFFDLPTTHLAGISGGNWYHSQFIYSKQFYESVTGINGQNITEAVSQWGVIYEASMKLATQQLQFQDITATVGEISPTCAASYIQPNATSNMTLQEYWEEAFTDLQYDLYWPASNYLFYVSKMLDPWIPNSLETSFSSQRNGYSGNATLVVGNALGPDIYSNDGSTESTLIGWDYGDFVPVRFTVATTKDSFIGRAKTDWWYLGIHDNTTQPLQIEKQGPTIINTNTIDLPLNTDTSIAEIAAGSGSAFGQFGSPTLFNAQIKQILARPALNLTQTDQDLYFRGISQCLPWGLQNISSQLIGDYDLSTEDDDDDDDAKTTSRPTYRWLDGAFSGDSTSIPFVVAQIQQDCKDSTIAATLDCTAKPKIVSLVPEARDAPYDTVNRLFGNCALPDSDCNQFSFTYLGDLGYSLQVFEETIPGFDDPGWTLYSNHSYQFDENYTSPYFESWIWRGDVTTVDNPHFGIEGGLVVDFVCFYASPPTLAFIIWPGYNAAYAWSTIYASLAQEQADSIKALLSLDSDGNEGLKEFFGVAVDSSATSTDGTPTSSPVVVDAGPTTQESPTTPMPSSYNEDTAPPESSGPPNSFYKQSTIVILSSGFYLLLYLSSL